MYRPFRCASLAVLILGAACWSSQARAQFGRPGTNAQQQQVEVFSQAPREELQHLRRANEALKDQRYFDAVRELVSLLERPEAEDYFTNSPKDGLVKTSLKGEAERLLGALPADARRAYEVRFGPTAKLQLEKAIAANDLELLTQVTRKYFHTQAGYQAALILGRAHLDRGRPLAAAHVLERLAELDRAAAFEPELSTLLAVCWLAAEQPAHAERALTRLQQRAPSARVVVGGREIDLFRGNQSALDKLQDAMGQRRSRPSAVEDQWVMYRGNPQRNPRSSGGMPLSFVRWQVPTANQQQDRESIRRISRHYLSNRTAALPSLQPLVVRHEGIDPGTTQDTIVMRTPWYVVGVDFKTGKRMWSYDLRLEDPARHLRDSAVSRNRSNQLPPRETLVMQRVWTDAPYGQMSSDGESIYYLSELGFAPTRNYRSSLMGVRGQQLEDPYAPKTFNVLVSRELRRQGYLQWTVGGETGGVEPKLAGAFFLGPPLPYMGRLYAMAEIKGDIKLVVLDAKTGQLLWQQQLAHVDLRTILYASTRRLVGASPSIADGVVICPTSAGAVVAVDLTTRSLRWGHQYLQSTTTNGRRSLWQTRIYASTPKEVGSYWADATATVHQGKVILTPYETDKIYCFDLFTGEKIWEQDRGERLYVAAALEDKVLVVGKQGVEGLSLANGRNVWKPTNLPNASLPAGRGFLSGNNYYLPIRSATTSGLIRVNVETGRIEHKFEIDSPLGNLVCFQDQIISQSPEAVAALYQFESLERDVNEQLAKDPNDPWALHRKGELLLHKGDRRGALLALRQAHKFEQEEEQREAIKVRLVGALLDALEDDFAGNQDVAAEVEALIDLPRQRAKYHRLMAEGLQQIGKRIEAFEAYLKLAEAADERLDGFESPSLMQRVGKGGNLSVRRDRWVRTRLAQLLEQADEKERARMNAIIERRYEAAAKADTPEAWRNFINLFGSQDRGDQARLRLSTLLLRRDELLPAQLLLGRVRQSDDKNLAAAATAHLARLYVKARRLDKAAACYQELADKFADTVCFDDKTGRQLAEQAFAANALLKAAAAQPADWPAGKASADLVQGGEYPTLRYRSSYEYVYPVEVRQRRRDTGGLASVATDRFRNLLIRDSFGSERMKIPLLQSGSISFYPSISTYTAMHARSLGDLLIVSMGGDLVAIDAVAPQERPDKQILWRENVTHGLPGSTTSRTLIRPRPVTNPIGGRPRYVAADAQGKFVGLVGPLLDDGVCYQKMGELVCVDPLTRETIWSRDDLPPGCVLFGNETTILAVPVKYENGKYLSQDAYVLRAADGELLGRKPVPAFTSWVKTVGGGVVTVKSQGGKLRLSLTDIARGQEVWNRDFAPTAKFALVENDEIAVLDTAGAFAILDLESGKPQLEAKLEKESSLSGIYVMRSSRDYTLMTAGPIQTTRPDYRIEPALTSNQAPLVNGRMYVFDRATGEQAWQSPARIDHFGAPLDQPTESPVLVMLRHVRSTARASRYRRRTSILILDKRDGRPILQDDAVSTETHAYQVKIDRAKNQVLVMLPGAKTYRVQLTDEPTPPAPPLQAAAVKVPKAPAGVAAANSETVRVLPGGRKMIIRQVNGRRQIQIINPPAKPKPAAMKPEAKKPEEKKPEPKKAEPKP